MAELKPAYLIHGDDHGRVAERRARLRALAERESGSGGLEILEGEGSSPEAVATALSAMTLAIGRRFIIVEGVERWKDGDMGPLTDALAAMPPDTTIVFFAREEAKVKAPAKLAEAVKAAGGEVAAEQAVKSWELPKWVAARARELDLELESGAARALVHHAGERPQRLRRELEKLSLMLGPGASVDAEQVEQLTAGSSERKAWSLADALAAADGPGAAALYLELRAQGERLPGLLYWMTQRIRLALDVVTRLDAGESEAQVRKTLRMPQRAAEQFIAAARRRDRDRLRAALERLADLEVDSRGGGALDEDTAALRAILAVAA